jgi:catechol 2,3-dioxygenase-like lactoylglutathione lyase family enzyme
MFGGARADNARRLTKEANVIQSIHSTPVYVSDQDAAVRFYTETLGFRIVDDTLMGEDRWVVVAPGNAVSGISLQLPHGMGRQDTPATVGGHTGISFMAEDVQKLYDELTAKGVAFDTEPQPMPWGGKGTNFSDPDGNMFFVAGA